MYRAMFRPSSRAARHDPSRDCNVCTICSVNVIAIWSVIILGGSQLPQISQRYPRRRKS